MRKIKVVIDNQDLQKEMEEARAAGLRAPFSVSKIKLCDICRHKALLKYCYKLDGEYDPATNIGVMFHSAMEAYGRYCVENKVEHDEEIARAALSRLRGDLTMEEWSNISHAATHYFQNVRFPVHQGAIVVEEQLAVNREWEPIGYADPDAYFRGKMDLVVSHSRKKATIWDYKSGYKVNALKNPVTMFQLRAYAALYQANHPEVEEVTVMNRHIRFNLDVGETLKRSEIIGYRSYVDDKIASIEADAQFSATIQDHCRICNMASACLTYQRYLSESAPVLIGNIREAMELGAKVFITEAELKKWKAALRAYTQKIDGPIMIGMKDLAFAVQSTPAWDIDPVAAVKELIKAGVDKNMVWENVSVTKSMVVDILKKSRKQTLIDPILEKCANKSARTTTGFVNIGDPELAEASTPTEAAF